MLVSVVIPVYNIKEYICDCVDSVLNQTYSEWECILVDDGSNDGSGEICDSYEKTHHNVRVVHKDNGGLAAARNTGLSVSKGEYIYFLDGDDMLTPEALHNFISNCNGADIVIGHMAYFSGKENPIPFGNVVRKEWVYNKNGKDSFVEIFKHNSSFMMGVRGLYRRDFLINNNLLFNERLRYSEDQDWTVRCFEKAYSMSSNEKPDYLYRIGRPGSLMNTPNLNKIELTLQIYDGWYERCMTQQEDLFYETLYDVLVKRLWNIYIQYSGIVDSSQVHDFYKMMDKRRAFVMKRPTHFKADKYMFIMRALNSKQICTAIRIKSKLNGK